MEIVEYMLSGFYQYAGDELLIYNGIALEKVGDYIVDILDENNVCICLLKIANECSVATRAEKKLSVFETE